MTQDEYIEILFRQCGYDTHNMKKAFLSAELGRKVSYTDELTPGDKSKIIDELKRIAGWSPND